MEQSDSFFPKDPNRRWVLAKLLNVTPALLALVGLDEQEILQNEQKNLVIPGPPKHVNVEAYYAKLQSYWIDGYPDDIEHAIDDIKARIDRLHDVLPYSRQKPQIVRLLCGYQIMLAYFAEGLQCYKAAKAYYTNAVTLAEEYKCRDLLGIALFRMNNFLFFALFDKERYSLDRAATLMQSPDEKLRSPDKAEECLVEAEKQRNIAGKSISAGRQAYSDLIQTKIYYDQGYDPVAAATAEQVLFALKESRFEHPMYLKNIENLLHKLKQHAPHENFVINLELALMKRQHPYLFN